jgi:protoheme IX farnesyltransferase
MKRTQNRPLPLQLISLQEAYWFTGFVALLGISLLWIFTNPLTTFLGILSMILYVFAYTPLKRVGPIAVFVGAIPGAMPPLLGWTAATGSITYEALIIFGIQFVWQFPHFWAIAWVLYDDYKKAGFSLLPSKTGKDKSSAFQIMAYSLALIPFSLMPWILDWTGYITLISASIMGIWFFYLSYKLYHSCETSDARKLMFASFVYLPIIQFIYVFDRTDRFIDLLKTLS